MGRRPGEALTQPNPTQPPLWLWLWLVHPPCVIYEGKGRLESWTLCNGLSEGVMG